MSAPVISSYLSQGGAKVVYHAPASEKYATCVKCSALLGCNLLAPCDEIKERTHVTVYENRIEYGRPFAALCCCVCDHTTTVYLDRPLAAKAGKAGCCTPACTHCSLCPTCFDACGEGVVLYGENLCTTRRVQDAFFGGCLLYPRCWMMMCGVDNAEELVRHINEAREACLTRLKDEAGAAKEPAQQAMTRA